MTIEEKRQDENRQLKRIVEQLGDEERRATLYYAQGLQAARSLQGMTQTTQSAAV